MPTKPRPWPNNALQARDDTLKASLRIARRMLVAQELASKMVLLCGTVEQLRVLHSLEREMDLALANASNITIHMQNVGARADETLHVERKID